jgi:predicted RNA-binding protein YlxR (DUF448 family)
LPPEPERTCVGCRIKRPKRELLRIVRTAEGRVEVDPLGKSPGRGAYVCRDLECVARASRKGALGRALREPLGPEDLARLQSEIERELKT